MKLNINALVTSVLVISLFSTHPSLFAQTDDLGTGSVRPKVVKDGNIEGLGGGYDPRFYFQEGKSRDDEGAHVYFEPLLYLIEEENENGSIGRKLKHGLLDDGTLVLFIRQHDSQAVKKRLRETFQEEANMSAKAEGDEVPVVHYRIDPLEIGKAWFSATYHPSFLKDRIISEIYPNLGGEGEMSIHFRFGDKDRAERFVEAMEKGHIQLFFYFQFAGVVADSCTAKASFNEIQDIDMYKKLVGEGREGFVSRDQVARLADEIVQSEVFTTRCPSLLAADELMDRLTKMLAKSGPKSIASWEELEKFTQLDKDSFRADLTEASKDTKSTVTRDYMLKAYSEAESKAESKAIEMGGEANVMGLFGATLNGSWADSEAASKAGAKKDVTDLLRKTGVEVEWEGEKLVPKSIDVYSTGELRSTLGKNLEIRYEITKGSNRTKNWLLTHSAWTKSPSQEYKDDLMERVEARLDEFEAPLTINSCLYEIRPFRDGIYDLGQSADTAILSGNLSCGGDVNRYDDTKLMLTRKDTTSSWLLYILDSNCGQGGGYIRTVFVNGNGVGKDIGAKEHYEKWGESYRNAWKRALPRKLLKPVSCSIQDAIED